MRSKIILMTLLVVGLVFGFALNSFGAIALTRTADVDFPGSPGATDVVLAAFTATEDGTGPNTITTFNIVNTGGTGVAGELAKLSLYIDVNSNNAFDFNDTLVVGATTTTTAGYDAGGAGVDLAPTTAEAFATAEAKEYLVVANFATTLVDNATFGAIPTATDGAAAAIAAPPAQTVRAALVVATHLKWNEASLLVLTAANADMFSAASANGDVLISAVDDYGNVDLNFVEQIKIDPEVYVGGASAATLTVTANGAVINYTGFAAGTAMVAGQTLIDKDGAVNNDNNIEALKSDTAEDLVLVASSNTKGLEGSITVTIGAAATAITGISSFRGIEVYDVDHNGYIDHVTMFYNAPLKDVTANNVPDDGVNDCQIAAFTVEGYVITAGTQPMINYDAGGVGIRNAGSYGVTLQIDENATPDTGEKPEVSYNSGAGTLDDRTAAPGNAVANVTPGEAVEVDKARPILMEIKTVDTSVPADGKVNGLQATFSENVVAGDATLSANTAKTAADPGAFEFGMRTTDQNLANFANVLTGTVSGAGTNVLTLVMAETVTNSGLLPVALYMDQDTGNQDITDSALNAVGAAAVNEWQNDVTTWAADQSQEIDVDDGTSPIVNSVTTGDADADGRIDRAVVIFSEDMNAVDAYSFGGVTFFTGTAAAFGSGAGGDATFDAVTGSAVAGNTITYVVTETTAAYDTEAIVTFEYDQTGDLYDANGFEVALYENTGVTGRTVVAGNLHDGAAPVIVSAITDDKYTAVGVDLSAGGFGAYTSTAVQDGRLDTYVATFSEEVTVTDGTAGMYNLAEKLVQNFQVQNVSAVALTVGAGKIYDDSDPATADYAPPVHVAGDVSGDTNSVLTFSFEEIAPAGAGNVNGGDTGDVPDFLYAQDDGDDVADVNGVEMTNVAFAGAGLNEVFEADGAKPVVMTVETLDFFGLTNAPLGEDNGNGDGWIDSFNFKFSEDVQMPDAEAVGGFTVDTSAGTANTITMDIGVDADGDTNAVATGTDPVDVNLDAATSAADASDNNVVFNAAVFYGTSDRDEDPDTEDIPEIDYDGTAGIIDNSAAANVLSSFADHATVDTAQPVIVLAIGLVERSEINVSFSEDVDQVGGAAIPGIASNVLFDYYDANDGAGAGLDDASAIAATVIPAALSGKWKYKIYTDADLAIDDVTNDMIFLQTAVEDDSPATNASVADADGVLVGTVDAPTVSIRITINDIIPPHITDAWTVDNDLNGWIDHIVLQFNEDVDDMTITGVVDANTNSKPDVPLVAVTGDLWDIAGYTGETWNFFDNGQAADAEVGSALTAVVDGVYEDEYFLPGNNINDDVLLLEVTEQSAGANAFSGTGDTDAVPGLVFDAGITLQDFRDNFFEPDPASNANIDDGVTITTARDQAGAVVMSGKFVSETEMWVYLSEQVADTFGAADRFNANFDLLVGSDGNPDWEPAVKDFDQIEDTAADAYGTLQVIWTDDMSITTGNTATVRFAGGAGGLINDLAPAPGPNTNAAVAAVTTVTAWIDPSVDPTTPTITMVTPDGSEEFTAGDNVIIEWTSANVATVDLAYSLDSGVTWVDIALGVGAAAGASNYTAVEGQNVLVRVKDSATDTAAISDHVFTVNPAPVTPALVPAITLLSPNGGESFTEGDDVNVLWTSENMAVVDVFYSMDGGDVWDAADANVDAAGGKYVWEAMVGDNVLIKVVDGDGATADMSDQVLTVYAEGEAPAPVPSVSVLSPNGGESFMEDDEVNILWSSANITTVDVSYSVDGGDTWTAIDEDLDAADGKLVWEAVAGANILVKVMDADGAAEDKSNYVFTVEAEAVEPPPDAMISLVYPNGGEAITATEGYTINIVWDAANFPEDAEATIYYQFDGGDWENVIGVDPVVAIADAAQDEADALQVIADDLQDDADALQAAYDDEYEDLLAAANAATDAANDDEDNSELAAAASAAWGLVAAYEAANLAAVEDAQDAADAAQDAADAQQAIADALYADIEVVVINTDDGMYVWEADDSLVGQNVRIKVESMGLSDMSDQVFHVYAEGDAPVAEASVRVLSPNGGETFVEETDVNILWTSAEVDMVDVMYSMDGGDTWEVIAEDVDAATGKLVWEAVAGDNMLVKVEDADGAVADMSNYVFSVYAEGEEPAPVVSISLLSPNGGESFAEGDDVNVLWTSVNVNLVDVFYSMDGGDVWEAADANIDAADGKYVWEAMVGENLLIKVVDAEGTAADQSDQVFWVYEPVEEPVEDPIDVSKTALNPVPADVAQINQQNVERVKFYGMAGADMMVQIKMCDMLGNEVMTSVVANDKGGFSGTIDASTLDDGMITLKAGIEDEEGEVATWYTFADYAKEAAALGAPSDLVIADVDEDNGMFVYATFMVSPNHFDRSESDFNVVNSYVFYREVMAPDAADANDTVCIPWADVRGDIMPDEDGMVTVMLPTKDNAISDWRVLASTGNATSEDAVAKAGDAAVATLVDAAAEKAAGIAVSAFSNVASGGAVDNVAPAAFVDFIAANNPDGAGVVVSWAVPTDVETMYQHGVVGTYTLLGQEVNIYGVDAYDVYFKVKGSDDYVLAGTAGPGSVSFIHDIADGSTAYSYYVQALDSNPDHLVATDIRSAIASSDEFVGDLSGDGIIDISDFSIFAANYGMSFADDPDNFIGAYDMNADGVVDVSDFSIFAANFGSGAKVAKAAEAMPTSDIPFSLAAEVDESTANYYVTVSLGESDNLKGFAFSLAYDTEALEFIDNSISGLVGLNISNVNEEGIIDVASWFIGEDFNGSVTFGFTSKGVNRNIDFELVSANVDDIEGLAVATNLEDLTMKALPTVYSLSNNYPNPFNPTTTIEYSIPQSGNVEIAVFNATGQKVRTLVNERQDASFYKVVWDGKNDTGESVASGLYIYRLVSGSFNKIEKMTLLK